MSIAEFHMDEDGMPFVIRTEAIMYVAKIDDERSALFCHGSVRINVKENYKTSCMNAFKTLPPAPEEERTIERDERGRIVRVNSNIHASKSKQAFELHNKGISNSEIAKSLGLKESSVKRYIREGRKEAINE